MEKKKVGRPLGGIPWNKGLKGVYHIWPNGRKPFSKETRRKIGLAGVGRVPALKGKPNLKLRGSKNPNWKGGVTSKDQTLRSRIEFKIWQREVFKINKKKCRVCDRKKNLIAHHKKDFKNYPKLRYDPKNGEIVCRACHLKIHKIRRKYV